MLLPFSSSSCVVTVPASSVRPLPTLEAVLRHERRRQTRTTGHERHRRASTMRGGDRRDRCGAPKERRHRRCGRPRESCRRRPASAPRRRSRAAPAAETLPVNGISMPNACVTSHACGAIASHSGNDQSSAMARSRGSRATAKPLAERARQRPPAYAPRVRQQRDRPRATSRRSAPDAWRASTSRPSAPPRHAAASVAETWIGREQPAGSIAASVEPPHDTTPAASARR